MKSDSKTHRERQEEAKAIMDTPYGGVYDELHDVDLWEEIIWPCKSHDDFLRMRWDTSGNERALVKLCDGDTRSLMHVRYLAARMFAFGFIRGVQQGTMLGSSPKGEVTASIVRHPSVVKLLLREPKVSTKDICRELDVVGEQLWWPRLEKKNRLWVAHEKESAVKMAISHARKEAKQQAIDNRFLTLIKAVGDSGSILDGRFNPKQRAMGKRR